MDTETLQREKYNVRRWSLFAQMEASRVDTLNNVKLSQEADPG